ncbi:MAG: AMP-binding protein, partial [Candidatus Dormibacteraeota bacterium]|nr:AMP-binding protein [Candidatus Dormibacteraeota bacterium]
MTYAGEDMGSVGVPGRDGAVVPAGVEPRLHDVVEHNACWFPDRPALIYESTLLTWEGFRDRLVRLAAGVEQSGVRDGDRIAVLAGNAVDYVVLQYALSLVGAILVPVNTRLAVPEIAYILRDCDPVLLLHDAEYTDKAAAAARDAGIPARVEVLDGAPAGPGLWAWA